MMDRYPFAVAWHIPTNVGAHNAPVLEQVYNPASVLNLRFSVRRVCQSAYVYKWAVWAWGIMSNSTMIRTNWGQRVSRSGTLTPLTLTPLIDPLTLQWPSYYTLDTLFDLWLLTFGLCGLGAWDALTCTLLHC